MLRERRQANLLPVLRLTVSVITRRMTLNNRRRAGRTSEVPTVPPVHDTEHFELFRFEAVVVERGGQRVLTVDNVVIPHLGSTVIVGPSGSGKSTLLRLCNRLEAPTSGTVSYFGEDIARMEPTELRRRVAMVFQQPVALEGSVADNLRYGDPAITDAGVEAALFRVGLPSDIASRPAEELSGGELQRLGLARSLTTGPSVLLLDEVTSSLDPTNTGRVESLVADLLTDDVHAVWVTHDIEQVRRVAEHVIVVIGGKVVQQGPATAVLSSPVPEVRSFFQGDLK